MLLKVERQIEQLIDLDENMNNDHYEVNINEQLFTCVEDNVSHNQQDTVQHDVCHDGYASQIDNYNSSSGVNLVQTCSPSGFSYKPNYHQILSTYIPNGCDFEPENVAPVHGQPLFY